MTSITITSTPELNDLLNKMDDIAWDRGVAKVVRFDHRGKNVTLTFDDAVIRAAVEKAARDERLSMMETATVKFNELVTKFEAETVVTDAEAELNRERSILAGKEAQIDSIRTMRGMPAETVQQYEASLEAQRAKVSELEVEAVMNEAQALGERNPLAKLYIARDAQGAQEYVSAYRAYKAADAAFDRSQPDAETVSAYNEAQARWESALRAAQTVFTLLANEVYEQIAREQN